MFKTVAGGTQFWFSNTSSEFVHFNLIGKIIAMAIYNGVILDLHFPSVVYKRLVGEQYTLADVASVDEELERGLRQLLTFDGDVEEGKI